MPTMDKVEIGGPALTLIKGEPGVGKSLAASTYPRPLYFFDFENKMSAIKNYYTNILKKPDLMKGLTFDVYRDWDTAWTKLINFGVSCPHKSLVFDALTSSAWLAIMSIVRAKGEGGKKIAGKIKVAGIEDYGGEAAALNNMIDQFITLSQMGVHIILTAHVLRIVDKPVGGQAPTESRTLMTGGRKVAAGIPGYFNETYHLWVDALDPKTPKYIANTRHSGDDFARTSLPVPGEIDWTNRNFYEELQTHLKQNLG